MVSKFGNELGYYPGYYVSKCPRVFLMDTIMQYKKSSKKNRGQNLKCKDHLQIFSLFQYSMVQNVYTHNLTRVFPVQCPKSLLDHRLYVNKLLPGMFIFLSCVRLNIRSRIRLGPEIALEKMLISSRCGGNMGATGI